MKNAVSTRLSNDRRHAGVLSSSRPTHSVWRKHIIPSHHPRSLHCPQVASATTTTTHQTTLRYELALCHDVTPGHQDTHTRGSLLAPTVHGYSLLRGWQWENRSHEVTLLRNHHMAAEPLVRQFHTVTSSTVRVVHRVEVPRFSKLSYTDRAGGRSSSDTKSGTYLLGSSDDSVGPTGAYNRRIDGYCSCATEIKFTTVLRLHRCSSSTRLLTCQSLCVDRRR